MISRLKKTQPPKKLQFETEDRRLFRVTIWDDGKKVSFFSWSPELRSYQLVSSYYVETLTESRGGLSEVGLCLHFGTPCWDVPPENMQEVFRWLDSWS